MLRFGETYIRYLTVSPLNMYIVRSSIFTTAIMIWSIYPYHSGLLHWQHQNTHSMDHSTWPLCEPWGTLTSNTIYIDGFMQNRRNYSMLATLSHCYVLQNMIIVLLFFFCLYHESLVNKCGLLTNIFQGCFIGSGMILRNQEIFILNTTKAYGQVNSNCLQTRQIWGNWLLRPA